MKYVKKAKPDYRIGLMAIGLSLFGLVMIASASVVVAYENFNGANDYYYVWKQVIALGIGLLAMIIYAVDGKWPISGAVDSNKGKVK